MDTPFSPEPRAAPRTAEEGQPVLALGGAGRLVHLLPSLAAEQVERWLVSGQGALWLCGALGSGRTTAAGAAVRKVAGARPVLLKGALRLEAAPGYRLEEALFEINEFLLQLGIGELEGVLHQRTPLTSKLSILLEVLSREPVLLWFDDFEWVTASGGVGPGGYLRLLLRRAGALPPGAGRLLFTSRAEGPEGILPEETGLPVVVLDRRSGIDSARLLEALLRERPLGEGLGEEVRDSVDEGPLAVRLRHAALAAAPPAERPGVAQRTRAGGVEQVLAAAWGFLEPAVRRALEVAAALRGPVGRGALRSLVPLEPGTPEEQAVQGLEGWGYLEPTEDQTSQLLRLHPQVRLAVERHAAASRPEAWKLLQRQVAVYLLEAGDRTGDFRYFLRGRQHLFESGAHGEAYEVQKLFLEDLLRRGFLELARKVLEEAAATTRGAPRAVSLGNLAIIHKNEGDLEEAARLYEEVRKEFESLDDQPNTARVYHQLGNTHYLRGDHEKAIESYRRGLEIALEINERAVAAATKIQIANVEYSRGLLGESLSLYREALALAVELQDHNMTAAIHLQIGQLLIRMRRLVEAEEELRRAEQEAREAGDRRSQLKVDQLLGLAAGERRDYDQALAYFHRARESAAALGDTVEMSLSLHRIGLLELERLHFRKAAEAFFAVLDLLDAAARQASSPTASTEFQAYRKAVEEELRRLARQVGPEVFRRILRGLNRPDPWPAEEAAARDPEGEAEGPEGGAEVPRT